jgi:signal transduction histidine kinase
MTFRRQLLVGQIAATFATLLTGVVAIVVLDMVIRDARLVTTRFVHEAEAAQQLRLQCERLVAASRGYLLSGEKRYQARFRQLALEVNAALDELRVHALADPARADIEQIEKGTVSYVEAVRRAAYQRSQAGDPRAVLGVFDDLEEKRESFVQHIDAFTHRKQTALDASLGRSVRLARAATIAVVLTAVLAIAIGLLLAHVVRRNVSGQFERVQADTDNANRATAARDQLLAVVAHDLRAPLAAVGLGAQSLAGKQTAPAGELSIIIRAADRMRHLIEELLDVSRIEAGDVVLDRATMNIPQLLDDLLALFQGQAIAASVDLATDARAESIYADRERVLRILSNLVANALNAVPRGGRITVAAHGIDGGVRFSVTDTGTGIAATDVPQVFARRWRADRGNHRGLGLGLYICKCLVEAHGGRIGVESQLGRGSTFWFELFTRRAEQPRAG